MKNSLRSIILGSALCGATLTSAQTYWYNGDHDGVTGLASYYVNSSQCCLTFDNFRTPNPWGMWVRQMRSNIGCFTFSGTLPTQAYVELRIGMAPGSGGTKVAGYFLPVSVAPTGRGGFGITEYRLSINTNQLYLFLQKGKYYSIAIAPVVAAGGSAFVLSTTGGNVGPANDGLPVPQGRLAGGAIFHSPYFGYNYASAAAVTGLPSVDLSYGVTW